MESQLGCFQELKHQIVGGTGRPELRDGHSVGHSKLEMRILAKMGVSSSSESQGFNDWCREGESNPQDPKVGGF